MKEWIEFANRLVLTPDEKIALARLTKEQSAHALFGVFGIFKAHGFVEKAGELLAWVLLAHPEDKDLRLTLAGEFYALGFIDDAWQCLHQDLALEDGEQNHQALNLLFKCAVLLAKTKQSLAFLRALLDHEALDREAQKIAADLDAFGFASARQALQQRFHDRRIPLALVAVPLSTSGIELDSKIRGKLAKFSAEQATVSRPAQDDEICWSCWKKLEKTDRSLDYLLSLRTRLISSF